MNKISKIILITAFLILLVVLISIKKNNEEDSTTPKYLPKTSEPIKLIPMENYSTSTWKKYNNNDYGVSFLYPGTWRMGDNNISHGTFQLFNYTDTSGDYPDFVEGMTKIEVAIIDDKSVFFSDNFNYTNEVIIAGQKSYFATNNQITAYVITIPSRPGKFLTITMYGDSSNKLVLEGILKSITWY